MVVRSRDTAEQQRQGVFGNVLIAIERHDVLPFLPVDMLSSSFLVGLPEPNENCREFLGLASTSSHGPLQTVYSRQPTSCLT